MKNEGLEIKNSLERGVEEIVAYTICHLGQVDIKTNLNFQSISLTLMPFPLFFRLKIKVNPLSPPPPLKKFPFR